VHQDVTVAQAGVEAVDELRLLFLALHRHHRSVTDLPLVADDEAWQARRATYLAWFAEGRVLLFVASAGEAPVGYALVVWHEGADDTFPLAPRYAELYTLSVAEGARGAGVGGRLLDGDARDVMAGGHVARTFVRAFGQCNAPRQAIHRRRERALVARAGDRERAAEAQAEFQIVTEALAPALRARVDLAGTDGIDAIGITGGQAGQLAQVVLRRADARARARQRAPQASEQTRDGVHGATLNGAAAWTTLPPTTVISDTVRPMRSTGTEK